MDRETAKGKQIEWFKWWMENLHCKTANVNKRNVFTLRDYSTYANCLPYSATIQFKFGVKFDTILYNTIKNST